MRTARSSYVLIGNTISLETIRTCSGPPASATSFSKRRSPFGRRGNALSAHEHVRPVLRRAGCDLSAAGRSRTPLCEARVDPEQFYDDLAEYYDLIFEDWEASMARQ